MRFMLPVLSVALLSGLGGRARAVDGIAVSALAAPCYSDWPYYGSIVKCTIANDRTTAVDTIYKRTLAGYPALNLPGTKCAFVRKDVLPTDTAMFAYSDAAKAVDRYYYLSVMDINGGNVHDLDTFSGGPGWIGPRVLIDWTATDIYYIKELSWGYTLGNPPTTEVWKVQDGNPSSQQLVVKYNKLYTFGLSLDAKRAGITSAGVDFPGDQAFGNLPHAFPPASEPQIGCWTSAVYGGCGSYVSPSGKYHQHFYTGGHEGFRINTWNPPCELLGSVDAGAADFLAWNNLAWNKDSLIGGGPMQWARWAVNSDKWICAGTQLYNFSVPPPPTQVGSNQVLVNWVDKKTVVPMQNWRPSVTRCTVRKSDPGDFWVAGGPCGSYEDVNGAWVAVSGGCSTGTPLPLHRGALPGMAESSVMNVYTLQGKSLGVWDRTRNPHGLSIRLPAGAYVASAAQGTQALLRVGR